MCQLPGFVDNEHPNFVCKIEKALYGMHQAGHNWNNLINADLTKFGMKQSEHDPCVYHKIELEFQKVPPMDQ